MIGYLKGEIIDRSLEKSDSRTILLCGDVGYLLQLPLGTDYDLLAVGMKAEFFVYTHVREDSLDLYGFLAREEKEVFITLLTVSGIGPRGALGLLSGMPYRSLITAIATADVAALTATPGIGKKTAERIILELGERMRKRSMALSLSNGEKDPRTAQVGSVRGSEETSPQGSSLGRERARTLADVRDALTGLGFKDAESFEILRQVEREPHLGSADASTILKFTLKNLRRSPEVSHE